ncbi:DUF3231 family protein [Bacillus sp. V2I10]|uniref:DUF3231 family protein n=1 Tax=Bacillus sp. V2I10 TaxID=3042276 RepID=UPI002787841F|nr:DUF3231 family protein [Bacillus sp. V2I10]MDQ0859166.1 hypothetical protein [Bacillus sp. V2I10]
MDTKHNIRLSSSEIAPIWGVADRMANCVLRYFLNKVEDTEISPIIEYTFGLTEENIQFKKQTVSK